MSQYRRNYVEGGSYFFTVVIYMRQPLLDEMTIPILSKGLKECISTRTFTVEAMVILPDHIHCIWQLPPTDDDYSSRWKFIKAFFTREYTRRVGKAVAKPTISMQKKSEKAIWQRRFWEHTIRDERDYRFHCDYIHYNPVKHGLVKSPRDWPHSRFHEFVEKGLYPESWGGPVEDFPEGIGGE